MSRQVLDAALAARPELVVDVRDARERLLRIVATRRPVAEEAARRAPSDPDLHYRVRMLENAARELEDILVPLA